MNNTKIIDKKIWKVFFFQVQTFVLCLQYFEFLVFSFADCWGPPRLGAHFNKYYFSINTSLLVVMRSPGRFIKFIKPLGYHLEYIKQY